MFLTGERTRPIKRTYYSFFFLQSEVERSSADLFPQLSAARLDRKDERSEASSSNNNNSNNRSHLGAGSIPPSLIIVVRKSKQAVESRIRGPKGRFKPGEVYYFISRSFAATSCLVFKVELELELGCKGRSKEV